MSGIIGIRTYDRLIGLLIFSYLNNRKGNVLRRHMNHGSPEFGSDHCANCITTNLDKLPNSFSSHLL